MSSPLPPLGEPIDESDLMAFVDGEISEDRRVEVLAHLATHPEDSRKVEAYLQQTADLRLLAGALELSDERLFCPQLQADLVQTLRLPRRRRYRLMPQAMAAGVATLLTVSVASYQFWPSEGPSWIKFAGGDQVTTPPTAVEVDVAAAGVEAGVVADPSGQPLLIDHNMVFEQPPGDGVEALAWLNEHSGDLAMRQPDFRDLGLTPVGGRILEDAPAPMVRLAYQDEFGERFFLYAALLSGEGDTSTHLLRLVPRGRVSVSWHESPFTLAFIGPYGSFNLVEAMQRVTASIVTPLAEGSVEVARSEEVAGTGAAFVPLARPQASPIVDTAPAAGTPEDEAGTHEPQAMQELAPDLPVQVIPASVTAAPL